VGESNVGLRKMSRHNPIRGVEACVQATLI
jgi:hypothetical protein